MKIDIHTHAWTPEIAKRAISGLKKSSEKVCSAHNYGDGTVDDLLKQLDEDNFDAAAICPIATKPEHFDPIFRHLITDNPKIIPVGSLHPADCDVEKHALSFKQAGVKMIKIHPYFQNTPLNDPSFVKLLKACADAGLPVLSHTGHDVSFGDSDICSPAMVLEILEKVPKLRFICAHCACWKNPEALELLLGKPVYVDIAWQPLDDQQEIMKKFAIEHLQDHVLFGSDWPWARIGNQAQWLHQLNLPIERENAILGGNAKKLLDLQVREL